MNRGLAAVLVTQFFSALADNAILFAAIALLKAQAAPAWQFPLLQEFFVAAFILLAPFVGPFADALPKGRVLLIGTALKLAGSALMLAGFDPFASYGLIGAGAAIYSPAKYGILSQLCDESLIVKANGWLESSTIAAILLGAVAGGALADRDAAGLIAGCAGVYAFALVGTFVVPKLAAVRPQPLRPGPMLARFLPSLGTLVRAPDTRLSLLGTALFWGAAAVLRFILIAWLPYALHIEGTQTVGYLNGATAVGIVIGAVVAGQLLHVHSAHKVLPAGVVMGLAVAGCAAIHSLWLAAAAMVVIGALGGFYVVPLNALLQERGGERVGAGAAVAVQNLFENAGMLVLVGGYLLLEKAEVAPTTSLMAVGLALALAMGGLMAGRRADR
ncbi:lysophospholipid transporter LplT [Derxia gummosa]|uniref:Lysophospholipid transporter LplT n=1 Tax=Derxia gummosa DSM 723 TaxID=1121388 RepID=A0A8B6X363_9BURK|nr:lysophospholipid transporter LplT [Derxia gummosa]